MESLNGGFVPTWLQLYIKPEKPSYCLFWIILVLACLVLINCRDKEGDDGYKRYRETWYDKLCQLFDVSDLLC